MTYAALLLAFALILPPREPDPMDGPYIAARYSIGKMNRVAKKRGMLFTGCGMSMDRVGIGATIRVTGLRTGVTRTCTVYDVSETIDLRRHLRARQIELDDASARKLCGMRYYRSRPKECPVEVLVLTRP
jgi:hypothetical protein